MSFVNIVVFIDESSNPIFKDFIKSPANNIEEGELAKQTPQVTVGQSVLIDEVSNLVRSTTRKMVLEETPRYISISSDFKSSKRADRMGYDEFHKYGGNEFLYDFSNISPLTEDTEAEALINKEVLKFLSIINSLSGFSYDYMAKYTFIQGADGIVRSLLQHSDDFGDGNPFLSRVQSLIDDGASNHRREIDMSYLSKAESDQILLEFFHSSGVNAFDVDNIMISISDCESIYPIAKIKRKGSW